MTCTRCLRERKPHKQREAAPGLLQCEDHLSRKRKQQQRYVEKLAENMRCLKCRKLKENPVRNLCGACYELGKYFRVACKKLGYCGRCGKPREGGASSPIFYCEYCRTINSASTRRYRAKKRAKRAAIKRSRERYQTLKSLGLCSVCGRLPPAFNKASCQKCLDFSAKRDRDYRGRLRIAQ
jgi:hypothetical protein